MDNATPVVSPVAVVDSCCSCVVEKYVLFQLEKRLLMVGTGS